MIYVYKHAIWHNTTDVIGIDPAQEAIDTADFEENYKSSCTTVSEVVIQGIYVEINKSYGDFCDLVDGETITWSDVLLVIGTKPYELYLITETPL